MNKIDEIILKELDIGKNSEFHGKDWRELSISTIYAESTIKKHLQSLEKQGLIGKSQLWNYKTATYYKISNNN